MKAGTVELEFKVKGGRITKAEVLEDGSCKLVVDVARRMDEFVLIKASELSLQDDFMDYEPKSRQEAEVKNVLTEAIKSGELEDFYRPKYDPSMDEDGDIQFVPGKKPAVGFSFAEWLEIAEEFWPERGSRIGTKWEYYAFLGVLIKKMVESGVDKERAWHMVCDDSGNLGHYGQFEENPKIIETGSHLSYGFCDLANTLKLISVGPYEYAKASGSYFRLPYCAPLAIFRIQKSGFEEKYDDSVGWIVLER
jgi:hypothetical protein